MPALDRFHSAVRNALVKDGWTITNDPFTLRLGDAVVFADLGAERLIAATKGTEKIAVEIKTFLGPSKIADLEQAIGQYSLYADVLSQVDAERHLVLAVPTEAFNTLFQRAIGQLALRNRF